jgi:class 3 adenylate cyclase
VRLRQEFDDPELEAAFTLADAEDARPRQLLGALVGTVLFASFTLLDSSFTDEPSHLLPMRIFVTLWLLGAMALIAFDRKNLHKNAWLVYSAVLATSWGLDLAPFIAEGYPSSLVTGGNMLSAAALFGGLGVRARHMPAMAGLLLAGWGVAAAFHGGPTHTVLANFIFITGIVALGAVSGWMLEQLRRRNFTKELSLQEERERSDRLLHNILPEEIAARLRVDPAAIADGSDAVTVVFADVVGFTPMAEHLPPAALVKLLDELFSEFDTVCDRHGVEKIKTIGDAYMAVAGVPTPDSDHAGSAARVAIGFLEVADSFQGWPGHLDLRVGLSSGPAVAGVIGRNKFAYDLWGDTVNTASRMESHGRPGLIQVSEPTRELLDGRYAFSGPAVTEVKGKGALTTYFLER